jgi:predicted DNA binding CopG/RHH family protein
MTAEREAQHSQRPSRIPDFASREEEAVWFETHDLADYQDEFRTVDARFAKHLSAGINIRLEPETLAELRREARQKGIGPTTLARMWILEHLQRSHDQR